MERERGEKKKAKRHCHLGCLKQEYAAPNGLRPKFASGNRKHRGHNRTDQRAHIGPKGTNLANSQFACHRQKKSISQRGVKGPLKGKSHKNSGKPKKGKAQSPNTKPNPTRGL